MKSVLLILIPVFLLSYFLAGGIDSPFPKKVAVPSGEPRALAEAAPSGDGKQLQINDLRFRPPSPQPSPPLPPTASQQPSTCPPGQKVAVDMLLDTSGSMARGSRINNLSNVVNNFVSLYLQNDDIIGIQEFSDFPADVVPINTKSNNSSYFPLTLITHNFTHMNDGMLFAQNKILTARSTYPGYNWVLIFLSDGVPETASSLPDPTQVPTGTASVIKASGVRIISIGLELYSLGEPAASYARNLMTSVASSPSDYHDATTTNLGDIYRDIAQVLPCT